VAAPLGDGSGRGGGEVTCDRIGDWANSSSGRRFWPADPRAEDVNIPDLALALARICRFGGHLRRDVESYSVAHHCVLVSLMVPPQYALQGLLHDGDEAFIGDPIRPAHGLYGRKFWKAKAGWHTAIAIAAGMPATALRVMPLEVKRADMRALATERRDLCEPNEHAWESLKGVGPYAERIVPMRPFDAAEAWLARFAELRGVAP
jgi:5'-deoxynucleotidase YfbR-like HD superfamily hydrolase